MEGYNGPNFEMRPELDPSVVVEQAPVDRLAELIQLLYKDGRDVVATDFSGFEADLRVMMLEIGCDLSVCDRAERAGMDVVWGRNYEEQRRVLEEVVGKGEIIDLERWGEELLLERGRGNRVDKRTGVRGAVVGQVLLDFYRFANSRRHPELAYMDAARLAERVNARRKNWKDISGGVKNPTPCSGEMMALILHYIRTGEKADWRG